MELIEEHQRMEQKCDLEPLANKFFFVFFAKKLNENEHALTIWLPFYCFI